MDDVRGLYGAVRQAALGCDSDCLALSGGLDSSIIACVMKGKISRAITVIAEDFVATDLTYCQMVAGRYGIPLNIIRARTDEILDAVEGTIRILASFGSITVRNAVVMYIAIQSAKRLGSDGIITGDGADEIFAGYDYMLAKTPEELQVELARMRRVMHFSSRKIGDDIGIRVESPFLDVAVTDVARSIPAKCMTGRRRGTHYGKWPLRKAFEGELPERIAWRPKSAMQDGAGTCGLTGLFESVITDESFEEGRKAALADGVTLYTKESMHYYTVFRKLHGAPPRAALGSVCPGCGSSVPDDVRSCRTCGKYPV